MSKEEFGLESKDSTVNNCPHLNCASVSFVNFYPVPGRIYQLRFAWEAEPLRIMCTQGFIPGIRFCVVAESKCWEAVLFAAGGELDVTVSRQSRGLERPTSTKVGERGEDKLE